jgi:hypothetical protein
LILRLRKVIEIERRPDIRLGYSLFKGVPLRAHGLYCPGSYDSITFDAQFSAFLIAGISADTACRMADNRRR